MTTTYLNVSSASQLSADITAIDLASQADGGNGTNYVITLAAGATLTERADISAIKLTGKDTLTINGQGAVLNGADAYRGLFVYSGSTTIENLTIENAVAKGGAGGGGGGGGRGLAAACSWPTMPMSPCKTCSSAATWPSAAQAARASAAAAAAWAAQAAREPLPGAAAAASAARAARAAQAAAPD